MANPPVVGVGLVCELLSPGASSKLRRSVALVTKKPVPRDTRKQIADKTNKLKAPPLSTLQDNASISLLIPSSNVIGSYPKSSAALE